MGSYTLGEFRNLVRAQLDADSDDLPDTLIDVWVREGWRFCVNRKRRWAFYASQWSFTIGPEGDARVPLESLGTPENSPLEIEAVLAEAKPLRWVGPTQGIDRFGEQRGEPAHWTQLLNGLVVLPLPNRERTFLALGYRKPVDWVADGGSATSDLPPDFDDVILNWSVGRAFQRQEDGDLGVMHLDQAEVLLRTLERRWTKHAVSAPLILNDGVRDGRARVVNWNV
jgi:hypothetical protein